MEDEPTCGKGLASHAPLAAKIGGLSAALADLLEAHTEALDLTDGNGRIEQDAYLSLVEQYRAIAGSSDAVAREMEGYRDLPMARHDVSVLIAQNETFKKYVATERALLELLQTTLAEHEQMLSQTGEAP